jgi:hypothetical protein
MNLPSEAIVFTINSAIRLGRNIQRAYANSIRAKSLVLPLPKFDEKPNIFSADQFFQREGAEHGKQFLSQLEHLQFLHQKSLVQSLSDLEKEEYLEYYKTFFRMVRNGNDESKIQDGGINTADVVALLKIRQWEKGKVPQPSALQLVAGSLVEIGIDYFNNVPGALNLESAYGRALKQFLDGFDDINIAESEDLKQTLARDILPKLFIGAAESLSELSSTVANDEQFQLFIKATANGLAKDLIARTSNVDAEDYQATVRWGQLLLSSLIKNAGHYVFSAPSTVLGTPEASSALIQQTGLTLLNIILDKNSDNINLRRVLTVEALDQIVRASLSVLAEYPELLSHQRGVQEIVSGVSGAVARSGIQRPDLLPEILRLVLEHTAGNLHLVWEIDENEAQHLLVIAVQHILRMLAQPSHNGAWRPRLSKTQMINLVADLLDEVVQHPTLVMDKVHQDSLLAEVLAITFQALEKVPKEQRLRWEVVEMIIQLNLRAVLKSKSVLESINWGNDEQTTTILNKILDLIFASVFDGRSTLGVERVKLLQEIFEYVMDVVVAEYPNRMGLVVVKILVSPETGIDFSEGFNRPLADDIVEAALILFTQHPDLIVDDLALQRIISGVADAVGKAGIHQPGLLSEIVRLVLIKTADNIELLVGTDPDNLEYLLVIALREILQSFGAEPPHGRWKPRFTPEQLIDLTEFLLDEVVQNPAWITDKVNQDSLLREVLDLSLRAMQKVPAGQRLNAQTFEYLLDIVLRGVSRSRKLLEKIRWADEQTERAILEKVLNLVLNCVFPPSEGAAVDKPKLLIDLLEFVFDVILAENPDAKGLALLELILSDAAGIDFSKGFDRDLLEDLLEAAQYALGQHPELISGKPNLGDIIADCSAAIHLLSMDHPNIGAKILSMVLENSADNLEAVMDTRNDPPKHLLVEGLQQIVLSISAERGNGRWSRLISEEQMLELIEFVQERAIAIPDLLKDDFVFRVLDSILSAMDQKAPQWRPPFAVLQILMENLLIVTNEHRELLRRTNLPDRAEQPLVLRYLVEQILELLFRQDKNTHRIITQLPTLDVVIDYFLTTLEEWDINEQAVDKAANKLQYQLDRYTVGDISLEDLLDELGPDEDF